MACCVSITVTAHKALNINQFIHPGCRGVSKCDFAMSRDVACRVSMFVTTYKTFNINNLSNQIIEGVSKL